jgi:hypothetical protein
MVRRLVTLSLFTLLLAGCATLSLADPAQLMQAPLAEAAAEASVGCAVTQPFLDQPPDDPNADPFGFGKWHINADRTLWVGLPPSGVWHTGDEKVIWIRPAGTELRVSGQRLDAEASPLVAEIPCCYPTGFQVTGLYFPTEGCWEVSATAGDHELRFVIEVRKSWGQPERLGIDPTSPLATSVLLQRCSASTCEVLPYDTAGGMAKSGYEAVPLARYATLGPSNDLRQLAIIAYRNSTYLRDGELSFLDLAAWDLITTTLAFDGAYNRPLFSPDNARLLVVTQTESWPATDVAHLVDVATGTLLAKQSLDFYPMSYYFSADGSEIIFFGVEGTTQNSYVALLDANTLELKWQAQVEGLVNGHVMPEGSSDPGEGIWWQPAWAFAPASATLYIVHADQEQLTAVEFASRSIDTRAITKPLTWIERLLMLTASTAHAKMANGVTKQAVLSSDGSQLYVIGTHYSFTEKGDPLQTGLGLQVIDVATGEISAHFDTEAQSLTFDPLSNRLFLHGWSSEPTRLMSEWTEVLDATSLEELNRINGMTVAVAHRLDGTPTLLATTALKNGETELAVLDPHTFEVISTSADRYRGHVGWVVMR